MIKVSRAQWIVRPHPPARAEIDGSLSKIENAIPCLLSAWPKTSPVMPAPIMRTLLRASSGLADNVLLNEDIDQSNKALNIRGQVLRAADEGSD